MCDQQRTKAELIRECKALRERVAELEQARPFPEVREALPVKGPEIAFVLENMPVMIDAFDQQGNIIVWNRECERVTGHTAEQTVGNPRAMELLYPDEAYRGRMMTEWKERGNDYYNWEWEMTAKDGSTKTVAWSNLSDRFPVAGWASWGIGVDVTESRQAFNKILSEEQRYRMLVETLADVVYYLDNEGNITFISEKVRDIFGFPPDEIIGTNFSEWIPRKELAAAQGLFQQVLTGRKVRGEIVVVDKEGKLHDIEFRSKPLVDEGELKGALGIVSDISKR